jgi:hypothetical protein
LSPVLHRPVYTLHVELFGIEPSIWRRVDVPADAALAELHAVLQIVMGWQDSHMHLFEIDGVRYGLGDNEYDPDEHDETGVLLGDLGLRAGDRFEYTYDFGDDWVHAVTLEAIRRDVPAGDAPRLVDGQRACPPEDCGGPPGYLDLLEALADPEHDEHETMKQWLGRPWDPEDFDVAQHDRVLRRWARPLRRRQGGGGRRPAGGGAGGRQATSAGTGRRFVASDEDRRDRTPPHMARAGEVLAYMDPLRRRVPWLPDSVVDLTAELIQRYCLAEPDEFLAVRKPELWLAAGVHAAFMLHPYTSLHPHKPLALHELAEVCGVSTGSIAKRSGQLRRAVKVEWVPGRRFRPRGPS